jgi:predicted dehydrogenase
MRLGVVIIGLGYWGPNLTRNFANHCDIIYLCDFDEEKLNSQGRLYANAKKISDYKVALNDPNVDIVVVSTPSHTHYALCAEALASGKHIFVTKPTTLVASQAKELASTAEKRGLLLHTDHTFLYSSAVRKLLEIVRSSDFGEINYIDSVRINLGLFQADTNVIWDLAPHDISILNFMMDELPSRVVAQSNAPLINGHEHLAYISMHYPSGTIANLHINWLSPVKVRRTIIGGTKKMAIYDDVEPTEKIRVYSKSVEYSQGDAELKNRRMIQYRVGDVSIPFLDNTEALDLECREFLDAVSRGAQTISSGATGYDVVKICESIDESLKAGGQPVEIQWN